MKKLNSTFFGLILNIAIHGYFLINSSFSKHKEFIYPVNCKTTVLDSALTYTVTTAQNINVSSLNWFQRFIAPNDNYQYDNLTLLFVISILIATTIFVNKEKKTGIFNAKLSKSIMIVFFIALAFLWLKIFRDVYFDLMLEKITEDKYVILNKPNTLFKSMEFWIIILCGAFAYILKKGERLKEEQDLTI